MSCRTTSYRITSYHSLSHHIISYHIIPYHRTPVLWRHAEQHDIFFIRRVENEGSARRSSFHWTRSAHAWWGVCVCVCVCVCMCICPPVCVCMSACVSVSMSLFLLIYGFVRSQHVISNFVLSLLPSPSLFASVFECSYVFLLRYFFNLLLNYFYFSLLNADKSSHWYINLDFFLPPPIIFFSFFLYCSLQIIWT